MKLKNIILTLLLSLIVTSIYSQIPTESEARQELVKRGINEDELRSRLLERGVDMDNLPLNDPAKLAETQAIIEEVMTEMESTKVTPAQDITVSVNPPQNESVNDPTTISDNTFEDESIIEEIQEELKEELPLGKIYGHHLFRNNKVKFYNQSLNAKPPLTYVIGAGDLVSVAIYGGSELNFAQEVTSDGYIKPERISRVYLAGLTIAEARDVLKRKFRQYYNFDNNTFQVNVSSTRSINVNISGEVFNVGSYSVSALNTAFNALVAAGGPSDIGSVRKIKVQRAGEGTKTLDVYKFMVDPLINEDFYLNDNDYIVVPVAEKVVEIKGAVNKPYRFELLNSEDLNDLITYAGGLKANALKRNISIKRIENDLETIIDVDLNELQRKRSDFKLKNGDVITINTLPLTYENKVTIKGAVDQAGEYAYQEGMKISDLLYRSGIKPGAILSNAYLMRLNPDEKSVRYMVIDISDVIENPKSPNNIELAKGDVLNLRARSLFVDSQSVSIEGAVRQEGEYPFNGGQLTVKDAIFLSGGLTDLATDFAFIFRDRQGRDNAEYIEVDLGLALAGNPEENISMEPGDRLVIYDRNNYFDQSYITISGAVKSPKEIAYDTSLSIKKALLLAGGLTFDASQKQIDIFRLSFDDNKKTSTLVANVSVDNLYNVTSNNNLRLQPFDQIVVRKAPEFELQRNVTISGEIKYPGKYALISDNMRLSEIVRQAGGTTDEAFLKGASLYREQDDVGYIIIDLEKALKKKGSYNDAILQKGDVVVIPKRNDIVTVTGAVLAREAFTEDIASTGKYSFVYEKGKNAKYYIDKYAGGVAKNGSTSKITVTYPNGEVKKTTRFLFFKNYPNVEPGSTINVGYKEVKKEAPEGEKEDIDWGKVLSDSVAQATTILTFILLINRID